MQKEKFVLLKNGQKFEMRIDDFAFFELRLLDSENWDLIAFNFNEHEFFYSRTYFKFINPKIDVLLFVNWARIENGKNLIKTISIENRLKNLDLIEEFINALTKF